MSASMITTVLHTVSAWLETEYAPPHPGGDGAAQKKAFAAEQLAKTTLPQLVDAETYYFWYMSSGTIPTEETAQCLEAAGEEAADVSRLFKKAADIWGEIALATVAEKRCRARERAWYLVSSILCKLAEDLRIEARPKGESQKK